MGDTSAYVVSAFNRFSYPTTSVRQVSVLIPHPRATAISKVADREAEKKNETQSNTIHN